MINIDKNFVHLSTKNNSYLLYVNKYGDLENLHYGSKISNCDCNALVKKRSFIVSTLYANEDISYCLDGVNFEYSTPFRGDSRSSAMFLTDKDKSMTDFVFDKIITDKFDGKGMPMPTGGESVCIQFKDKLRRNLLLQLWYVVYEDCDVICKFSVLINNCGSDISLQKAMSAQYDFADGNKTVSILDGAWGRERQRRDIPLVSGKITAGSFCGMSSMECNPFFMLLDSNTTEKNGNAYAFNLMYSGSHEISVERTPYGSVRVMHGVQSEAFNYTLKSGEKFMTPIAVSTFSACGVGAVSCNMQNFASEYVIPKKNVPIMLNSWESVYFELNEQKLIEFADKAKTVGFDGVVIDDGWFLGRNDDYTSLGDWFEDKEKFPNGIKAYADYLNAKDMRLGIWIEPEMVSEQSKLYKAHPEWALECKNARKVLGRNQLILDLTQKEVAEYIYAALQRLVVDYGASYVKWDFNRRFSDIAGSEGSGYFYRYYTSLYEILDKFTSNYPNVVMENCASGGGRFDLGMLKYFPFGWVSDNTDPLSRAEIQNGTSYGYPVRSMLNHISASPSHQTKRITDFETRKNTALIGSFGAQYDITKIDYTECERLKNAILQYKEISSIVQNGNLYRLSENENYVVWQIMFGDNALVYLMQKRFNPVTYMPNIKLVNLDKTCNYNVKYDCIDITASGETLMNFGINMPMNYQGYKPCDINLTDMTAILFSVKKI